MTEIEIIRYNSQGEGVCYIQNKIAFVPFTMIGDTIVPTKLNEHSSYIRVTQFELKKASPNRVLPKCSYFSHCGGCQLQHLPYPSQLKLKKETIANAFFKIAKISPEQLPIQDVIASPNQFHYRESAQFHISNNQIGFRSLRSNQVIQIDKCLLLSKELQEAPFIVKKKIEELKLKGKATPTIISVTPNQSSKTITLSSKRNNHEQNKFNQINEAINNLMKNFLYKLIEEESQKGQTLLDLFCGNGNFSISLHPLFSLVIGVDYSKESIAIANQRIKKLSLSNYRYIKMDCQSYLKKQGAYFDWVIVDPARSGMKEVNLIAQKVSPTNIVYISCNPTTLARDVANLVDYGYTIKTVQPFDMFPQTYHVETVVLLSH